MKAMIFAAGLGTRLKPLTETKPKALVELDGSTLLDHAINYLREFGVSHIIVNVHHFADDIIEYIKRYKNTDIEISISDERDELKNTGGGLKYASHFFDKNSNFILMNVDIVSNVNLYEMIEFHQKNNCLATLAVSKRKTSRYLLFNDSNKLSGWINQKTHQTKEVSGNIVQLNKYAFSGIQIINSEIFKFLDLQGNFSIIDAYLKLSRNHKISYYDHTGCDWMDVGKIHELSTAEEFIKRLKEK